MGGPGIGYALVSVKNMSPFRYDSERERSLTRVRVVYYSRRCSSICTRERDEGCRECGPGASHFDLNARRINLCARVYVSCICVRRTPQFFRNPTFLCVQYL